jgi:methionyl-tRNA formyltransferase
MKIIFIGSIEISQTFLLKLISLKANVVGVCTLKKSSFNSDHVDLSLIAKENNIPAIYANDINSSNSIEWIKDKSPNIIFCFGWSRLLKKGVLSIPTQGVVGYHPAELPYNRGRHPIIWALVLGLKSTASTFFYMKEGADDGDIISQEIVKINFNDNARTLYNKISRLATIQMEKFHKNMLEGNFSRSNQDHSKANYWRKRNKEDGVIDWRMSALDIYNLVRALSEPYIGAHFIYDNKIIKVWSCDIVKYDLNNIEPGKVLSLGDEAILVKAGKDAIILKDIEPKICIELGEYI